MPILEVSWKALCARRSTAGLLVAASLFACAPRESPPTLSTLPEFSLLDQRGAAVTRGSLAGRPFIADFFYTRCPAACPRLTAKMKEFAGRLPDGSSARLVSISVDPRVDRPEVLAAYAASREISDPRWLFLTGELEAIRTLVHKGFLLPVEEQSDPANPILHSNRFALVDAMGRLRGTYEVFEDGQLERLLADLEAIEGEEYRQ